MKTYKALFRVGKTRDGKTQEKLTLPSGTTVTILNSEVYKKACRNAAAVLKEREKERH